MMTVFRQALLCLLLLWLPVSGRLNPAGCVHPITITPAYGYALIRPQAAKLDCCWMLNWRTAGKPTGVRRARRRRAIYRLARGNACGRLVLANPCTL